MHNSEFKRWKVGDAIDKPLPCGKNPSWGALHSRYWKNRAVVARSNDFTKKNLNRIKKGRASKDFNSRTVNDESSELPHNNPQRNGVNNNPSNLYEVTPDQHAGIDPYR